ncbi:hypothetical protein BDR04DRAFT_1162528 [Suillus decipiens]|nr:hypothetical protein BDR04DRAFT_1162528 [Suillus decipiens]
MSIQESNHALLVADKLLHKALAWVKHFQADGCVAVDQAHEMSHRADAKQPTHIAAMTSMEPKVDQPAAIASADDFPADHWQEDLDTIIMPLSSPPYFPSPLPHLTESTILDVESTVWSP